LGLLLIGLLIAVDGLLLDWLVNHSIRVQQINMTTFLVGLLVLSSLPFLLFLAYQTASCLSLRYRLDRNSLVVHWLGMQQVFPIRDIQRIVHGDQLGGTIVRRRGVRWPGHERGEGLVPGVGRTRFLASRPLSDQLLVVTPGLALGISPRDPEGFLTSYAARRELGPNRLVEQETQRARWLDWSLWTDRPARGLLGVALLINLGLFGYLCARFPNLDLQLPLHFNIQGMVDRIGVKTELFALPIIGLIILATNLVLGLALYKRERAGTYLLWGSAAAAQALFWLAALSIVA